jgi:hypothetical protein
MKALALAMSLTGLATGAAAQARPYAPSLGCAAAAQIIRSAGAIVMGTGPGTYDRFVRDGSFCLRPQTISPVWVATADSPQCFVGYRCVDTGFGKGR